MSFLRAAVQNTLARVAATTPETVYGGTRRFVVVRETHPDNRADAARTRQASWTQSGEMAWDGTQTTGPYTDQLSIGLVIEITYTTGRDLYELGLVLLEDVIALARSLADPTYYDADTTGVRMRTVGNYSITWGDEAGDTTTLALPVTLTLNVE